MDFKTVKALSSPTRIRILNCVLEKEQTPTEISNKINKSKSTVASHLEKLSKSGLIIKDQEKGRKRVLYKPTEKAEHIVKGKEKKVTFTLTSSIISMLAGIGLLTSLVMTEIMGSLEEDQAEELEADSEDFTMTESPDEAADQDPGIFEFMQEGFIGEYLLPGVGGILILAGVFLAWQSFTFLKLKKK